MSPLVSQQLNLKKGAEGQGYSEQQNLSAAFSNALFHVVSAVALHAAPRWPSHPMLPPGTLACAGLVERVCSSSRTVLVVSQHNDPQQMQLVRRLKSLATEAWSLPGHPGWSLVLEPVVSNDYMGTTTHIQAGGHRQPLHDTYSMRADAVTAQHRACLHQLAVGSFLLPVWPISDRLSACLV